MDGMLNVHNPHQCYVTKTWSRYLSYYQPGLGARGIGYRDSMQDLLAVFASVPQESEDFIRTLLSFQKRDGSAVHQFNPLTLQGSEGDSLELEDRPHYYSDDHLWGVLAVTGYLKETGDLPFLDEIVPFYDRDKRGTVLESASVLEHLKRALAFTRRDTGRHGLPLLGFADWNDTVNLPTGAESLFTADPTERLPRVMRARASPDPAAPKSATAYHEMRPAPRPRLGRRVVRRLLRREGAACSSKNTYGQIQPTAGLGSDLRVASPQRGRQAMDSVYRKLNTKFGIKLSTPGFNGYDPKVGGVTTYPPGAKENGGIFLHPNPWAIIAEAILGNGERAFEYYAQINPLGKNDAIEVYECEPYVYAQNFLGDEHPQFGLARKSWLTGTASWCYQAATQWILGIRPEYEGLRIEPCIPSGWSGFSAVRRYRGQEFRITVHNPLQVCSGVAEMRIDGAAAPGNLIPADIPGTEHSVEVWLGA
jgi:cellobiose phosphorylase